MQTSNLRQTAFPNPVYSSQVHVLPGQNVNFQQSIVRNSPLASPNRSRVQEKQEEEEIQQDVKSDQRIVNFCILLLPFVLSVLFFIASLRILHTQLNTTKTLEGSDDVLEYVHDNLNADPILFWRSSITSSCPNDYDKAKIGKWHGIERGCLCKNGLTITKDSFTKCLSLKDNGCEFQKSIDDEHFHYWVDNDVLFCEKRLSEHRWEKVAHCDVETNTLCGSSVCIKGKNAECPPNVAQVSEYSNPSASLQDLLKKYGDKTTTTESNLIIRKNGDTTANAPAIEMLAFYEKGKTAEKQTSFVGFEIAQGKTLCLNKNYALTNNVIYHLDVQQTQNHVCDQYGSLAADQITVLDTAFQSQIYKNNDDLNKIYQSSTLVDYNAEDYNQNTYNLLAVQKIKLANKAACDAAYEGHLNESAKLARHSRTVIRVFSWILLVLTIITVLLGILFIMAALYRKISTQHNTKVKVARLYWFSAWFLVAVAFLIFLLYHIFFTLWLGNNEEKLQNLQKSACFPDNAGINLAISKLISYDSESTSKFGPLVNELFWYATVYSLIWMGIIAFWKNKYSQVKDFIAQ